MNYNQLEYVIEILLGQDNQKRIQAEEFINNLPIYAFEQGIDGLLQSMNHQNQNIAAMAALLLKKKYLDIKQNMIMITQQKCQWIIKNIQNYIKVDRPVMFLKRCCDILVKIFTFTENKNELFNLIQILSQSNEQNIKIAMMYLIEIICEYAFDDKMLLQFSTSIEVIFQKGMEDSSYQVRVASFKTLTIFLSSIQSPNLVKKFQSVLQILLNRAIQLIKFDQDSGIIAIESINQLIEVHPKFIKPILNQLLMIFTQIAETSSLLTNLRISALYGILLLAINHATLLRKNQYFKTKTISVYIKTLSENQNISLQEWAQQLNEQIISKNDISLSTQEHLSQLLNQLGNKFLLPMFIPRIQQCLQNSNPSFQHAGLISMAILNQNCHHSFKKQLPNIMNLILPLFTSQNPKIIYDILIAMGYMAQQFAPQIQQNYGDLILQFISKALSHPFPKVQYKAVQCIQNFQTGIQEHKQITVMQKYIDEILNKLSVIFQNNLNCTNYLMLQAVLDSISSIASMNSFIKYYLAFMPGLKKIISIIGTETSEKVLIRSKTIETMGYLLASVKDYKQTFMPDCQQIMQSLINISNSLQKDDPIHRATFVVYQNVLQCLKGEFTPYSDRVFKKALQSVNSKVDFAIIDQYESQKRKKDNRYVKMKIDLKIEGVKNIILNTDSLQQKLEASNLLSVMAQQMGTHFGPYIESMIPTVNQLISFKNSKEIRNNMIQIAKYMILACVHNEQKLYVLQALLPNIYKQLGASIRKKDHQQIGTIIEALTVMLPCMNEQMIIKIPEMMVSVITTIKNMTKQIEKIYSERQMDEDMQEQMDNQIMQVQQVLVKIEQLVKVSNNRTDFVNLKTIFPKQYEFDES